MWGRWGTGGSADGTDGVKDPGSSPTPHIRGVPPHNSAIPLRIFGRNSSPYWFATPPAPGPPRHPSPHHPTRPLPLNSILACRRRPSLLPTPQRRLPSPRRRQPECPTTSTTSPSPAPGLFRPRHPRAPPPPRSLITGTLRLRAHGRRTFLGRYAAGGVNFGPRPPRRAIGVLKMVLRSSSLERATMPRPPASFHRAKVYLESGFPSAAPSTPNSANPASSSSYGSPLGPAPTTWLQKLRERTQQPQQNKNPSPGKSEAAANPGRSAGMGTLTQFLQRFRNIPRKGRRPGNRATGVR